MFLRTRKVYHLDFDYPKVEMFSYKSVKVAKTVADLKKSGYSLLI